MKVDSENARAVGDADTFAALFYAHFGGLVRLATLIGADDPEDVVQESFARLHHRSRFLRDPGAALPYLRTTVINLSRSRLRHLVVARRHVESVRHDGAAPDHALPEHSALLREDQREVVRALGALPARQREALVLRYWQELSVIETAETMGISVGAVKSHTARALAALGQVLEAKA